MNKKNLLTILLVAVVAGIAGILYDFYRITEKFGPQTTTIVGSINWISNRSEEMNINASDGNNYDVVIASSTQIIRDAGGTVHGTFGFGSLRLRDSVSIVGKIEPDGSLMPSLVEQTDSGGID